MKSRWLFALLFFAPIAVAVFFWDFTSELLLSDNPNNAEDDKVAAAPEIIVEQTELTQFSPNGIPSHILQSELLVSEEPNGLVYISSPNINIDSENSELWDAVSEQGIYDQKDKSLMMQGNVRLIRRHPEDDPITVTTDILNYFPEKNIAESEAKVIIETLGHKVETLGISVDFDRSIYKLKSQVKSRHDPI